MQPDSESFDLASGLDALSGTFTKDREFCKALAKVQPTNTARILVFRRWASSYLPEIQDGLLDMADRHFIAAHSERAAFWTASLTGGLIRDLGLIPYLAVRGLVWEAGTAARRGLENVGLLAHLWREPAKAAFLDEPESRDFRNAFINESNKDAARELKARSVQKRFSASISDQALSQLYRILSEFSVHGASPSQLATTTKAPTRLSCMFVNRPDPTVAALGADLETFGNACEMLCLEAATIFGQAARKHKVPWSRAHEGGKLLSALANRQDPTLRKLIEESLKDLHWSDSPHS